MTGAALLWAALLHLKESQGDVKTPAYKLKLISIQSHFKARNVDVRCQFFRTCSQQNKADGKLLPLCFGWGVVTDFGLSLEKACNYTKIFLFLVMLTLLPWLLMWLNRTVGSNKRHLFTLSIPLFTLSLQLTLGPWMKWKNSPAVIYTGQKRTENLWCCSDSRCISMRLKCVLAGT